MGAHTFPGLHLEGLKRQKDRKINSQVKTISNKVDHAQKRQAEAFLHNQMKTVLFIYQKNANWCRTHYKWIAAAENSELKAISRMTCISCITVKQQLFYSEQIYLINYDSKFIFFLTILKYNMIIPKHTQLYTTTELTVPHQLQSCCCNHATPPRALKASLATTSGYCSLICCQGWISANPITLAVRPKLYKGWKQNWDLYWFRPWWHMQIWEDFFFFPTVNLKCFQHHHQINIPGLHAGVPFI